MKYRLAHSFRTAFVCAVLAGALSLPTGCNKSEQTSGASTSGSTASNSELDLSSTLVAHIPENSLGFFHWNASHAAYQKLAQSPWGGGQDLFSGMVSSDPQFEKIVASLKKAGIDVTDRKSLEAVFSEGVIFAAGDPGAPKLSATSAAAQEMPQGALAILFRGASGVNLQEKLAVVRKEIVNAGGKVSDLKLASGSGFTIELQSAPAVANEAVPDAVPPTPKTPTTTTLFVATNGDLAAAGSKQWAVEAALGSKGSTLPAVVNTPEFKEATRGFPDDKTRFATGFFHVSEAIKQTGVKIEAGDIVPLRSVAFAAAMGDTPQSDVRFVVRPESEDQKRWFSALSTSPSATVLAALPANPLLFLSVDGTTLKKIKELALAQMGEGQEQIRPMVAVLDNIKRLAVSARVAPVGQSMLPVPDLMFMVETDATEQVKQQFITVAGSMAQEQMGGVNWSDKTIDGVAVKALVHPMGFGLYVASSGNLVLAASTEAQLRSALGSITAKGAFASKLPERSKSVLASSNTLGNLYLDFQEAGSLATNLQGMMSLFAPQGTDTAAMFDPARIESIKKMGSMVGSVTVGENLVEIKSFYQPSAKGAV